MRVSLIRRATASAPLPLSLQQASAQLIPPIPRVSPSLHKLSLADEGRLYRRLLRVHRYLPPEMRFMGDSYVKSEFRLTRKTDNPLHIIAFLGQWKLYLDEVQGSVASESTATGREARWTGRKLDMDALNKLSKEQVGQLYELMHATKDVWKSTDELEDQASTAEAADGIKEKT